MKGSENSNISYAKFNGKMLLHSLLTTSVPCSYLISINLHMQLEESSPSHQGDFRYVLILAFQNRPTLYASLIRFYIYKHLSDFRSTSDWCTFHLPNTKLLCGQHSTACNSHTRSSYLEAHLIYFPAPPNTNSTSRLLPAG